jgi:hypothetical protein
MKALNDFAEGGVTQAVVGDKMKKEFVNHKLLPTYFNRRSKYNCSG